MCDTSRGLLISVEFSLYFKTLFKQNDINDGNPSIPANCYSSGKAGQKLSSRLLFQALIHLPSSRLEALAASMTYCTARPSSSLAAGSSAAMSFSVPRAFCKASPSKTIGGSSLETWAGRSRGDPRPRAHEDGGRRGELASNLGDHAALRSRSAVCGGAGRASSRRRGVTFWPPRGGFSGGSPL